MKRTLMTSLALLALLPSACERDGSTTVTPKQSPAGAVTQPSAQAPHTQAAQPSAASPAPHAGHGKHGHAPAHGDERAHAAHGDHHAKRFEDAGQWSKVFDDPARDAWQKPSEVVRLMQLAPGATVADLGAGTGYFLPYLSRAVGSNGHVLALDIEPDMVRHMRERAAAHDLTNVEARQIAPDDPTLPAASIDRVLIVNTWHHIPNRVEYGRKLLSALRTGGVVFVVDYTLDSPQGPPKQHRLRPERVAEELRAAGFNAEQVDEPLPLQYIVAGRTPGH